MPLAMVEGDVLSYLDEHGPATLQQLVRIMHWSAPMVTMGVGALIRSALADGAQRGSEIIVRARPERWRAERRTA